MFKELFMYWTIAVNFRDCMCRTDAMLRKGFHKHFDPSSQKIAWQHYFTYDYVIIIDLFLVFKTDMTGFSART